MLTLVGRRLNLVRKTISCNAIWYQFGAEAFEAAYPKMDSVIKPDEKAPSVPKTGKVR